MKIQSLLKELSKSIAAGEYESANNQFVNLLELLIVNNKKLQHDDSSSFFSEKFAGDLTFVIELFILCPETDIVLYKIDDLLRIQSILSKIRLLYPQHNLDRCLYYLFDSRRSCITQRNVLKIFLLLSTETSFVREEHEFLSQNHNLYIATILMLVWSASATVESESNRNYALTNFNKFGCTFQDIPISLIHGVMMHCSYSSLPSKHNIKKIINGLLRSEFKNYDMPILPIEQYKETIFIIFEVFNKHHSVYRVLGPTISSLIENFNVVAIGYPEFLHDDLPFEFDDLIHLTPDGSPYSINTIRDLVKNFKPKYIYYPAIGMAPWTIFYSNLRLAPIQFATIGHGASTYTETIDYFVIESDIAGSFDTYSEQVIPMPPFSMPYYMPYGISYTPRFNRPDEEPFSIGCVATSMKINTTFLTTVNQILTRVKFELGFLAKVTFNIYVANLEASIESVAFERAVRNFLPDANIFLRQPFQDYINALSHNHLLFTTFPFGGMNGMMDSLLLRIPSVVMDGNVVHEAFDSGVLRRIGIPSRFIAYDLESYVNIATQLIVDRSFYSDFKAHLDMVDLTPFFGRPPNSLSLILRKLNPCTLP